MSALRPASLLRLPVQLATLPLRLLSAPGALMDAMAGLERGMREVTDSVDKLAAPGGTLARLADLSEALEQLAGLNESLSALAALEDSLPDLAHQIASLQETVETFGVALDPLSRLAGRMPGGRRRGAADEPTSDAPVDIAS